MSKFITRKIGCVSLEAASPVVMGILNTTPDSFSDGGHYQQVEAALRHAHAMVEHGAEIIDIGGESSRPGALPISLDEEMQRVLPIIEALVAEKLPVALSIDTTKSQVADAALHRGVAIVNDISALRGDDNMAQVVAKHQAFLILMHMEGTPETMHLQPLAYSNVVAEVFDFLKNAKHRALRAGIAASHILLDPGIGFAKDLPENLALTRQLHHFHSLRCPIVYGPSRKRFLGEITQRQTQDRDRATAAACTAAILSGAHVLRVHNVAAVRDACQVAKAIGPNSLQ